MIILSYVGKPIKQVKILTSNLGNIKQEISADDAYFLKTGNLPVSVFSPKKTLVALKHLGSTNSKTKKKAIQNYVNFLSKS